MLIRILLSTLIILLPSIIIEGRFLRSALLLIPETSWHVTVGLMELNGLVNINKRSWTNPHHVTVTYK